MEYYAAIKKNEVDERNIEVNTYICKKDVKYGKYKTL